MCFDSENHSASILPRYSCMAKNCKRLIENSLLSKVSPQIVLSPRNLTVPEGNTTEFFCKVIGFPKPAVTWKFNNGTLPPLAIEKHSEVGSYLLLPNVTKDMEGSYKCTAKNKAKATSATSTLCVLGR